MTLSLTPTFKRWLLLGVGAAMLTSIAVLLSVAATPAGAQAGWEPVVEIDVPFRDENNDGTNDYDGRFPINFTRTSAASTDSPAGSCPASSATNARIGSAGILNSDGNQLLARVTLARSGGFSAGCTFSVTFPDSIDSGVSGVTLTRASGSPATVNVSSASEIAASEYVDGRTTFEADITFNGFDATAANTSFTVNFTNRILSTDGHAACELHDSVDQETYQVQSDGSVERTSAAAPLISSPPGTSRNCRYTINWPEVPGWSRDSGSASTVRPSARSVAATYRIPPASRFTPNVTIVAPFVDVGIPGANRPNDDINDFYDSETNFNDYIEVTFRRVEGPMDGCSPDRSVQYMLGASARTQGGEEFATFTVEDFDLIDNPRGEEERHCVYEVVFPTQDRWLGYIKIADIDTDDTRVHNNDANQDRAHATYTTAAQTFALPRRAEVTAPTSAAGQRVHVAVSSDEEGCTSTLNPDPIRIGADGTGFVPSANTFIDRPQGYTNTSPRCTYTATWSQYELRELNAVPSFVLSQAVTELDHTSTNSPFTATYVAFSGFVPSILINIPTYDGRGGRSFFGETANGGVGAVFPVTITPPQTPTGCSPQDTHNYRVYSSPFANSIFPTGGEFPVLINVPPNQPGGATAACAYEITFPTTVSSMPGGRRSWTLRLDGNAMGTIQASQTDGDNLHRAERNYLADEISLDVTLDINVPQYDADGTTNNAFAGRTFTLRFDPIAGSHQQCSSAVSRDFTVGNDGALTGTAITLVDRPARVDDQCEYDVTVPASVPATATGPTLTRASGFTTSVKGDDSTVSAAYHTMFDAPFTVTVTQYDTDGTTANAFTGEEIIVSVARTGGPATGCSTGDTTFTIDDAGDVTATLTLNDGVGGEQGRCAYTVTFPENEDGGTRLIRQGAQDRSVEPATAAFTVAYEAAATNFAPDLEIAVPFIDASGANALADATVTVTYTLHVTNPVQHTGCTSTSPTETWTIASGGSRSTGGVIARGTPASLVDRPQGQTVRCRYVADVTDSLPLPGGDSVTLASDADNQDFIKTEPVRVVYVGDTFLTPAVSITVPPHGDDGDANSNYYQGTTFDVTFTVKAAESPSSGTGCIATETQTYTVGTDGTVTLTSGSPTLVDVPRNEATSCVYEAAFPPSRSSAPGATPAWTLTNEGAATADVSEAAPSVTRSYAASEITFAPTLAITVPQVVGLTPGENLFAGQTFAVSVVREAASHADCSLAQSTSVSYTVGANGTVSAARAEPSLATLVDYPAGEDNRCRYTVMFDRSRSSTPGEELSWRLTPGPAPAAGTAPAAGPAPAAGTVTLTASAPDATGAYTAADITYFPDATISVPTYSGDEDDPNTDVDESTANAFVALKVDVAFASTASGCTDASLLFTVQPDSSVTPDDPSATLVAYPADSETLCTYDVTFPPNETTGTRLELQSGASSSVTGIAQAIMARYLAAQTTFVPDIEVVVPFIDSSPADEMNDLAQLGAGDSDRTVTITYAPDEGADTRCVSQTETYRIDATAGDAATGGRATRTAAPVTLVDRPAGEDERCSYSMTVEEAETLVEELPVRSFNPNTPIPIAALDRSIRLSYSARSLPAPLRPGAVTDTRVTSGGPTQIGSDFAELEGFVPTTDPRLAIEVSVTLPEAAFEADATVEVLLSAPGACGADMFAFDGVPASVGLAYAMGARSGATLAIAEGAHALAAFAERDDDGDVTRQPCVLRVTVLTAPAGCTLVGVAGAAVLTDDAERSYVERSWSEGDEAFSLTPALTCESSATG